MIFGVISAMVLHLTSPAHTASPVSEGQNLDDVEIKVKATIIFRLYCNIPPPPPPQILIPVLYKIQTHKSSKECYL